MSKIQITLDATKLRPLVVDRSYTNKNNEEVRIQEIKIDLIEVKDVKIIYEKDNMQILKTHFVCQLQTKEEREAKKTPNYIGEGFTTIWKNNEPIKPNDKDLF